MKYLILLSFLFSLNTFANTIFIKIDSQISVEDISISNELKKIKIKNIKQDLLVINLWATWCQPCISEMPMLDKLSSKVDNKKIKIIALSQDDGGMAIIKNFYSKYKIKNLDIFIDSNKEFSTLVSPNGYPTTYLVRDGKIIGFYEGVLNDNVDQILAEINKFK